MVSIKSTVLSVLIVLMLIAVSDCTPCTKDDYIGTYSECKGGLKNLIYYKNPESSCEGYDNMPENKFNIPCGMFKKLNVFSN